MILGALRLHSARDGHTETLLGIRITNDGTGTPDIGHYDWQLMSKSGSVFKHGRVENWPRLRKTTGQLLAAVMRAAYPNEGSM